ncbi:MAG: MCE family protein [Myxococcales bacterium]|nr:MAG: MCE family protein [Myxococcales bacterium]
MITLGTKIKVIAFVVISLLAATHLAITYMGVGWGSDDYRVTASLPRAGGAFKNGEVTYLGVPVGRIESITATSQGSDLVLRIDGDAPAIPEDVKVQVTNRSAIGEQYLNLISTGASATKLSDGDTLLGDEGSLPQPIDELLRTSRDFVQSVPSDALNTVIDETYQLSQGAGPHLAQLIETSADYADTAESNFLVTAGLIENSQQVLDTQLAASSSIKAFSRDLNLLSETLEANDKPLRGLIDQTPAASQEIGKLFSEVGQPLGVLMSNLVSTAHVFGVNSRGLEDAMMNLPEAISVGYAITGSYGIDLGLAQTFFDPLPCTSGYGGTTVREGLQTGAGKPFNTAAGCTADPSSGTNVRGPRSAPNLSGRVALRVPTQLGELLGGSS